MNRSPSWDLLGSFIAVVRAGSLSGAARLQRTAQPTVRRHIESLESDLGVVLFSRSPNGLVPTDAARQILPYAEVMASTADALVRAASAGDGVTGAVRIAASELMAAQVLPSILAPLLEDWPALDIELTASDRNQDLLRRDADIAVRMARPTQAALVARRVGITALGLFASEAYLARCGAPTTLADLIANHRLIGQDRESAIVDAFTRRGVDPAILRFAFRSDSDSAQLAAIEAGVGVGVCQIVIAARRSRLRRILPPLAAPLEVWVVAHEDLRDQPRVRMAFDRLVAGLGAYLAEAAQT